MSNATAKAKNEFEAKHREIKARRIASALAMEAARRGASIRDTVLPIVDKYAKADVDVDVARAREQTANHLKFHYDIKRTPSVVTWERVAEILTEVVEGGGHTNES